MSTIGSGNAMRAEINPLLCTGCRACIASCPRGALQEPQDYCCAKCVKYCLTLDVPCTPLAVFLREDLCDGCGKCVPACPEGAIRWEERPSGVAESR